MSATIMVIATAPAINVPNDFQFCEAIAEPSQYCGRFSGPGGFCNISSDPPRFVTGVSSQGYRGHSVEPRATLNVIWLSIAEYAKVNPCVRSHGEDLRFEILRAFKRPAVDPCDHVASMDTRALCRAAGQRLFKDRAMGYGHTVTNSDRASARLVVDAMLSKCTYATSGLLRP
jgi:hypothetical protein